MNKQNEPWKSGPGRTVNARNDLEPGSEPGEPIRGPGHDASTLAGSGASTNDADTASHRELVSDKTRQRLEASGLMEPDEVVVAYLDGQGVVSPVLKTATGVLLLRIVLQNFRAFVLTDRHVYVFDMKFGGAGAVRRIRAKHRIDSVRADLSDPRRGWRTLQLGDNRIYVRNRPSAIERAEVIIDACTYAAAEANSYPGRQANAPALVIDQCESGWPGDSATALPVESSEHPKYQVRVAPEDGQQEFESTLSTLGDLARFGGDIRDFWIRVVYDPDAPETCELDTDWVHSLDLADWYMTESLRRSLLSRSY